MRLLSLHHPWWTTRIWLITILCAMASISAFAGAAISSDLWQKNPNATIGSLPVARYAHTAVWTGSEMIVWGGGYDSTILNDGGRFNPVANSWSAIARAGAPSARGFHTAVWTGSEMIVWGELRGSVSLEHLHN